MADTSEIKIHNQGWCFTYTCVVCGSASVAYASYGGASAAGDRHLRGH